MKGLQGGGPYSTIVIKMEPQWVITPSTQQTQKPIRLPYVQGTLGTHMTVSHGTNSTFLPTVECLGFYGEYVGKYNIPWILRVIDA